MTLLEGLLDDAAARYHSSAVTGALATASAGRAAGSAAERRYCRCSYQVLGFPS